MKNPSIIKDSLPEIRRQLASGKTASQVARDLGCSRQHISQLLSPLKEQARRLVQQYLAQGILVKAKCCQECGTVTKTQAHHADYAFPIAVQWLCSKCHGKCSAIDRPAVLVSAEGKNPAAVALGRLGAGHAKTMSQAAIEQRRSAVKLAVAARQKKSENKS